RVKYERRGIAPMHRNAAHQFGGLGVYDFDRAIHRSSRPDARIIEASGIVIGPVVRVPLCGALSACQLDGLDDFVGARVDGYNGVVSEVYPDFIGLGIKKRLAGIFSEPFGLMDNLAGV